MNQEKKGERNDETEETEEKKGDKNEEETWAKNRKNWEK